MDKTTNILYWPNLHPRCVNFNLHRGFITYSIYHPRFIVRPFGLHYNRYVNLSVHPSVCYHLVKMFITLEPHGIFLNHMIYFYHILHTYACQYPLTTGMGTHLFLIDMAWLCNCLAFLGQLVKIHRTLEPYGMFKNFACLFIFKVLGTL